MSTTKLFGIEASAQVGSATLEINFKQVIPITWGMLLSMLRGDDTPHVGDKPDETDETPPPPQDGGDTPQTPPKEGCVHCGSTRRHRKGCPNEGGKNTPPVETAPPKEVVPAATVPEKHILGGDAAKWLLSNVGSPFYLFYSRKDAGGFERIECTFLGSEDCQNGADSNPRIKVDGDTNYRMFNLKCSPRVNGKGKTVDHIEVRERSLVIVPK